MKIRPAKPYGKDLEKLIAIHKAIFPADSLPSFTNGWWWLVYDGHKVIAFAGLNGVKSWNEALYLSRCGVDKAYRGQGLQKRLIKIRERKARKLGIKHLITSTYYRLISANNLINCGFRLYQPENEWLAKGSLYWKKDL